MHVVDRDERRTEPLAEFGQKAETARLVAAIAVDASEEAALRSDARECADSVGEFGRQRLRRQGDEDLALLRGENIAERQVTFALLRPEISLREKPAEPPVGRPIGRIGQHLEAVGSDEPRADQELEALAILPFAIGPYDPGETVAVGDADRGKTERVRGRNHFLRMRGPAQEREVGRDGKFGVEGHRARSLMRTGRA
jgi:hypothetical protein